MGIDTAGARLSDVAALASANAAAGEEQRRLSPAVVEAMRAADLFRLCVPASIGGAEAHPLELLAAVETLARGDGAAGWCLAVQATTGLLAGYLEPSAARTIFGGAGSVAGGVFAPRGRAEPDGDTLRVSGRWPFASGCTHADWLCGGCLIDGRDLPNGMPDVVLVLAPISAVTIHDTWDVAGLRGTGSHDMELAGVEVPAAHAASVFSESPHATGPLYAFPLFGLLAVAIAGVSLGVARGALDDLVELAGGKTPQGGTRPLAQRATVQADAARAEAALRAARAGLLAAVAAAYDEADASGEVTVGLRTGLRLAATHAATAGEEVAQAAYRLGGGSAIYASSPLQRRFRDANVATQHMLVGPSTWELTGRLVLGLETDVTQL